MADSSYSAGNLEMKIQAVGSDATASLSSVNTQLQTMVNLLGVNNTLYSSIQRTARGMSRMTFNWTEKLASGLKNITTIDTRSFYNKMQSLIKIMQPFVEQLSQAQVSLVALQKVLASTGGKKSIVLPQITDELPVVEPNTPKPKNKTLSFAKVMGKLYFIRNYTKQIGRGIANMVQNAINYTETLNLWQVAMRNNRAEAEKFVETMNKAYGISEQTLMNYQATFKNMLSALGGISDATSYALSEYLTQMALDYASLYNTSIERAMTIFQSVLSGQVRPIRSISGYDITETTIYQLYQQLGGTKTMRQLTQTEKRLLRIYAVFQQMENSGTIGDLNKTLNNSANQLRILSEGLKELGTWFGVIMEMYLQPILPYLNAFVITMKNITKAVAIAGGYKPFEGGIEGATEYSEALDEVTGKLLSFDRFEALNSSQGNDNILGIDESLLAGLSKYESILAGVTNKATELAQKWSKFWINDKTGELTVQGKIILGLLKSIGSVLLVLIGLNLAKRIGLLGLKLIGLKKFNLIGWLQNIQLQGALATTTTQKLSVMFDYLKVAIVSAVLSFNMFSSIIDMFEGNGKRIMSIISIVIGGLGTILGLILAIKGGLKGGLAGAIIGGLGVGALIAGIKGVASANAEIQVRKTGGLVEDGIFTMNKKEIIGKFDDGSTVVANDLQIISGIENASYRGHLRAMRDSGNVGNGVGDVYLDKDKVGRVVAKSSHNEMQRIGLIKANS